MSQACLDLRPLFAARPLGVLDPEETAALDAHLATCAGCRSFTGHVDEALAASAAPPIEPAKDSWDRLARRLAEGKPGHGTSIDLKIAVSCTFCHETLERAEAAYCASCLAPHHEDCFEEHGRCSAPGCSETRTVQPRERAPRPVARPPRLVLTLVLGLVGVTGVAAMAVVPRVAQEARVADPFAPLAGVWEGGDFGPVVIVGKTGYYNAPGTGVGRIDLTAVGDGQFKARFKGTEHQRWGPIELAYVASTQTLEGTWRYDEDVPVEAKGPYTVHWTRETHVNQLGQREVLELRMRFAEQEEEKRRLQDELERSEKERKRLLERILRDFGRGFLGLAFSEKDGRVVVDGVFPGSPADQAGIKSGDRVVLIDDTWVRTVEEVQKCLQNRAKGDNVVLQVQREGRTLDVRVTLADSPKK